MQTSKRWADPGNTHTPAETPVMALRPDAYLRLMFAILALVLVVNLASIYAFRFSDDWQTRRIAMLFLLDHEKNFATLFNFSLIAANAALLGVVSLVAFSERDSWRWHWMILGLLFLLLAYDEAASFHERLIPVGRAMVPSDGVLFFTWVIFGAAFVLTVAIGYLRFLLALPRRTALRVALAGGVYVGGALGIEFWGGHFASANGMDNIRYNLIASIEETMEMAGQILFGYALLRYLGTERAAEHA